MKQRNSILSVVFVVCMVALCAFAANVAFQAFLPSQFFTDGRSLVAIKTGANVTNLVPWGTLQLPNITGGPGQGLLVDAFGNVTAGIVGGPAFNPTQFNFANGIESIPVAATVTNILLKGNDVEAPQQTIVGAASVVTYGMLTPNYWTNDGTSTRLTSQVGNAVGMTNYQATNLANGGSSPGQILTATASGVAFSNAPAGQLPTFSPQFSTANGQTNIVSGVNLTNAVNKGTFQLPGITGGAGQFLQPDGSGNVTAVVPPSTPLPVFGPQFTTDGTKTNLTSPLNATNASIWSSSSSLVPLSVNANGTSTNAQMIYSNGVAVGGWSYDAMIRASSGTPSRAGLGFHLNASNGVYAIGTEGIGITVGSSNVITATNTGTAVLVGVNNTNPAATLDVVGTGKISGTATVLGNANIHGANYVWPTSSAGGTLQNDGSGNLTWTPVSGVTIPNTIKATNFVLNTVYTNTTGSIQLLDATVALITTGVSGNAALDLMADQSGGTSFTLQDRSAINTLITSLAQNYTNNVSCAVSNGATYYFTNSSSGAGDSAVIVSGTGAAVTLSDGAAANVASLSGNNSFSGLNTFNTITNQGWLAQAGNATNFGATTFVGGISNVLGAANSIASYGPGTNLTFTANPANILAWIAFNGVNSEWATPALWDRWIEEFDSGSTVGRMQGWTSSLLNGGNEAQAASVLGHMGQVLLTCYPTNATSYSLLYRAANSGFIHGAGSQEVIEGVDKIGANLPSGTNLWFYLSGALATSVTYPSDGVWFQMDGTSAFWQCVLGKASTYTTNITSTAYAASTYYRRDITVDANTNIIYYIGGTPVYTNPLVSTFPTAVIQAGMSLHSSTAGGTNAMPGLITVDEFALALKYGASR